MRIYNTLTRRLENFKPFKPPAVGMYTCGPTVYDYAHIGNFRTYIFSDLVLRTLKYLGYKVKYIMNITDVGHLVSDGDEGEDKLEKGAKREGKTAWDIAKKYEKIFIKDSKKLNLIQPDILCRATEHIKEQIELIQRLEKKNYTYKTSDGIYFDTGKLSDYGKLTQLDIKGLKEGARIRKNPEKKNATDFALWKFSPKGKKRDMEWKSPWGVGFPGWHIECSAMSIKYLGETFDIHLGGVDLKPVHHTNEIAQSEAATCRKFVNYWIHGEFILVNGRKMSKSKGNFYNLRDVEKKGFEPLALRYFYLNAHYRTQQNFTWEALAGAQNSLDRLSRIIEDLNSSQAIAFRQLESKAKNFRDKFVRAVSQDFNMPEALAVVWEVVKSNLADNNKQKLLLDFDRVLGLDLGKVGKVDKAEKLGEEIKELIKKREELRKQEKWEEADKLRKQIEKKGYLLEDTSKGIEIKKKTKLS